MVFVFVLPNLSFSPKARSAVPTRSRQIACLSADSQYAHQLQPTHGANVDLMQFEMARDEVCNLSGDRKILAFRIFLPTTQAMQQKMILLAAVIFAVLAFLLSQRYIKSQYDKIYKGAVQIKVVTLKESLTAGSLIELDNLKPMEVFERAVGTDVIRMKRGEADRIIGRRLKHSVKQGDPLRWFHVDLPVPSRKGIAETVKDGLRALSIPASGVDAVSGLIKPNDRVDVIATYVQTQGTLNQQEEIHTTTLIQDVGILATGTELANQNFALYEDQVRYKRGGGTSYSMVTVEVTPREAELLVHVVKTKGTLTLTLRNPGDADYIGDIPEVDAANLKTLSDELNRIRQTTIRKRPWTGSGGGNN